MLLKNIIGEGAAASVDRKEGICQTPQDSESNSVFLTVLRSRVATWIDRCEEYHAHRDRRWVATTGALDNTATGALVPYSTLHSIKQRAKAWERRKRSTSRAVDSAGHRNVCVEGERGGWDREPETVELREQERGGHLRRRGGKTKPKSRAWARGGRGRWR